jgi:hypothetical protein
MGFGVGLAAARDGGTAPVPGAGAMMGSTSMGAGMMGSGAGMMGYLDGQMPGSGMDAMMTGPGMEAMHAQMMATMTERVPAQVLARCQALHDQMTSPVTGDATTDADA